MYTNIKEILQYVVGYFFYSVREAIKVHIAKSNF